MNIFPSTLFTSTDSHLIQTNIDKICQQLNNEISPNNPDIFIINEATGWAIESVRLLKKWLSQKPFNHKNKIIIIYQVDQFSLESQNALLKSLEEPGENNYFILSTNKPSKIINTIISRCQIIKLKNDFSLSKDTKPLVISDQIKTNLFQSENISKDKNQVLPFLENQLKTYQQLILKNPTAKNSQVIQKILKSINMIEANVDPRSALDFLFLS
ncbi:MAG: AAA family ATPase [Candidatus Shapirobacteria bacterium]|nr:AAA family ATPase [Candidatus Shapirobacteria bacterium]